MNNPTILALFGAGESVNGPDFSQILLREVQRAYLIVHQKNDEIYGLKESLKKSLENKEIEDVKVSLRSKEMMIEDYANVLKGAKGDHTQEDYHRLLLENNILKQQVIYRRYGC